MQLTIKSLVSHASKSLLILGLFGAVVSAQAAEYPFKLAFQKEGNATRVVAENPGLFPVQVDLELKNTKNVANVPPEPINVLIPPQSTMQIARLQAEPERGAWNYDYSYKWWIGDPNVHPSASTVYRLPFADGKSYRITQAHGGPVISHNTPATAYAVDIAMPKGDPVLAARDGVVVETESRFGDGAPTEAYLKKANFVRIMHDDGTWAEYFHLLKDSVTVKPGQRVKAGTMIGRAGDSGFSDGSHLHFAIQKNDGTQIVSLPFEFYTASRGDFLPTMGDVLYADNSSPVPALAAGTTATGRPAAADSQNQ